METSLSSDKATFLAEEDIAFQLLDHFRSVTPKKRTLIESKKFIETDIVPK